MPQTQSKVKVVALHTRTTNDGDECVRRSPPIVRARRADVDIIRVSNRNDPGSGDITVFLDPDDAAEIFDPVPAPETLLHPGGSVDWTVKGVIDGSVSVDFRTDPDNCEGQDQGDIIIEC